MIRFARGLSVLAACALVALGYVACGDSGKTSQPASTGTTVNSASTGSPTSAVPSLESDARVIALKFAKACFEVDLPTLQALSAPKLNWSKRAPGDLNVSFEQGVCLPASRCIAEFQRYPCKRYEVQQLQLTDTTCDEGTPADIANGLGARCLAFVRLALRLADTTDQFRDTKACFLVQEQDGRPLVTDPGGAEPPTGCLNFNF